MNRIACFMTFAFATYLCASGAKAHSRAAPQAGKNEAATKADLEKLQGVWYHSSREEKGKQVAGEAKDIVIVFRGNVVVFKKGTEVSQVCFLKNFDALSNPKKVDLEITDGPNEGRTVLGIYEIKDGVFRYCGSVAARPTSFTTAADDKGYVYCSSYKRLKK
jgi:uncharacterized protein (TIGR03067 family)